MKIALPTKGDNIDDHFGHCEGYTIFSVNDEGQIEHTESVPSPEGCGCKSNIATILKQKGVTIMLAGNMGDGAMNVLKNHNIMVYRGCSGNVKQQAEAYLKGQIGDSGIGCAHTHGEGDHQCTH